MIINASTCCDWVNYMTVVLVTDSTRSHNLDYLEYAVTKGADSN